MNVGPAVGAYYRRDPDGSAPGHRAGKTPDSHRLRVTNPVNDTINDINKRAEEYNSI